MREINIFPSRSIVDRKAALMRRKQRDYSDFGQTYFDAEDGVYGGYHYDGRYAESAKRLVQEFNLHPGDKVLELGCAKGFVLCELQKLGMDVAGIDRSQYAVENCHPSLKGRVHHGMASDIDQFRADEFHLIFAKEMLPHLGKLQARFVAHYMARAGKQQFLEIQCAPTPEAAMLMAEWDPTHKIFQTRDWWIRELLGCGYRGSVWFKDLF